MSPPNGNRPVRGAAHSVGEFLQTAAEPTNQADKTQVAARAAILKLYIGGSFTGVTVEPDAKYPSMWRFHMGQHKSGMVNLTRAKDAAIVWARPKGLGGTEVAHWHRRQTPARTATRRFLGRPATYPRPRGREPKNPDTVRNSKRSTSHERSGVRP